MRKVLLVLGVVAACAAAVIAFLALSPAPQGPSRGAPAPEAGAEGAGAAAEPRRETPHEGRARAAEEAPRTLAVAGVVKDAAGAPVAGAAVDAFAVPAAQDVPDDERAGREILSKLFPAATVERLLSRGRSLRAGASFDADKIGEFMREGVDAGIDLLTDDGGADALAAVMRLPNELLLAADAPWPRAGSAVTAADGTFRIEGMAPGRVELRAKAAGHVKTKVRAAAGDANVSITLVRGVRLAGTVTCEKEPVVGASVRIQGAETTTGAGGRFEFDAAHVPTETLVVSAVGCVAQGRTVPQSLDGTQDDVAIVLDPAGAVEGHVGVAGGGPIAGARIAVAASGNLFTGMMGAPADRGRFDVPVPPAISGDDGAFAMQGVRLGDVKLRVDADGYIGTTVSVSVKRGKAAPCAALLVPESVLAGTVTGAKGEPVAGAKVRVEVPARDATLGMVATMLGGTFRSTLSDAAGRFVVRGLVEGERKFRVQAEGYLDVDDTVEIPARGAATRDVALREGYRLAGSVASPDGKPAAGAKIVVVGRGGGATNPMLAMFGGRTPKPVAESAADGTWSATGLQEGPYEVRASAEGWLDAEQKDVAAGRTDVALTLAAGATLRGRVLGTADMKPVAGASVQRRSADAAGPRGGRGSRGANPMAALLGARGPSVVCDRDGNFEMKAVEAGTYELVASMKGFAESAPARLTCTAGETLDGIEIMLPPGVSVAGRVVDRTSGAAVQGAVVWVARAEGMFGGMAPSDFTGGPPEAPAGTVSARSDADGRFVLDGLSPGKATVEVRVADRAPATLTGVTAPATDLLVQVSAGGAIEGRVTGSDGSPVPEAQVMATRGMMGQGMRRTTTDADGAFRIDRLQAGSWNLMLMDPANPMMPTMAAVVVKEGETTRHDFTKKQGGRQVGGGVSRDGKPLASAPVLLMGGSAGMRMSATDENGRFAFEGLDPGEYTVVVQGSFLGSGATSRRVTVGSDGKVDDVNLELSSAKVEGDVVDADTGKGVAGAQVVLTERGASVSGSAEELMGAMRGQALADERGHFVVNDVATGTFTVKASAAGWSSATLEGVASGARTVRVEIRRGVEFVVTVRGPDDAPVANATVQTVDAAGNASLVFEMSMSGITRADGTAHLRLAPGRYTVKVGASNLVPAQAEIDTASGSATVRLDAGATLDLAVTDGASPVVGAKVTLLDGTGAEIRRGLTMESFLAGADRTTEGGRWSRTGLAAGKVTVVVTDAAGRESRTETTLEMNAVRHVDVVVK